MSNQPRARVRQPDSLAATIADLLDDFQIPLPSHAVRIISSERRGQPVVAEQLARVAAYERDNFLRTRMPPLLCSVIDRRGLARKPRIWGRGDWRLARRIATPDVQEKWQAQLARRLCEEILYRSRQPSEQLAGLALEAVARVIGAVAAYLPGTLEQWQEFRDRVAAEAPDYTPGGTTAEQEKAEKALLAHEPAIAPVGLYFGLELSIISRASSVEPARLRLPAEQETPEPFDHVVRRRLEGDEQKVQALVAYLQGWSYVRDEIGRGPTSAEFADYWHFDMPSVRADEAAFREAFPEEEGPERIIRLLEEGLPRSGQLVALMSVGVIDEALAATNTMSAVPLTPGQRWRQPSGVILTLTEVRGETVIGHLSQHGTTSIWAGSPAQVRAEFSLDIPKDLWLLQFDVDVLPSELNEALTRAGIQPTRFARPSDPRPNQAHLRLGTIEAQIVATDEREAKVRLIRALARRHELSADQIRARRLGPAT
jgi:hypothetical protein